uniref:Disease resistance RPP13-like protein 4 n=1 Tax=Cajanus cajan TaxID=3821 RepID=A0A151SC06_CAJCA|nr:Disease resistance RPP13-like protein 4 [Cajanus cajan]
MSIRTNPMKAVNLLLKRLMDLEQPAKLKNLKSELFQIRDLFSIVKKNKDELLDMLTVVDGYLRNSNIRKLKEEEIEICNRLRGITQKLLPGAAYSQSSSNTNTEAAQTETSQETFQDEKLDARQVEEFKVHYYDLDRLHKRFFLSLLLFPKNAVIKKSTIHFWWASVVGYFMIGQFEYVFDYLFNGKMIVPYGNDKRPNVKKFKINPCVRHALMLDQKKVNLSDKFGLRSEFDHWRAIFNVGASYLNIEPEWIAKMKHLEVLQLGRWLHDSPKHHIEVMSEEFFKELRHQRRLKYLSLRGISRIFELPPSIFQLESLAILDLKACHNLETLPYDISSLKKLRHLNLSQCYLLGRMPKGIEKLTNLEVLKGFVIDSSTKTPYRISDLAKLKNLEQLSIHIASGALIKDGEYESFKKLEALEHLKISWGASDNIRYSDIQMSLPSNLKTLHLEGFPEENIPEWLKPSELPKVLKELSITGGKLKSLNLGEYVHITPCSLDIVRLKYLKHLNLEPKNLQDLLASLIYIEIKGVPNFQNSEYCRVTEG